MTLNNSIQDYDASLQKTKTQYSGLMGLTIDGSQKVNIPSRSGYVYVRLRDSLSEVLQAFNDKVSPVYDFPVLVERKGNRWYVVGRDDQRYENWGTPAPYLPQHGDQHSFNRDGGGGGDTVFVYPDQFMPLLVYPSGTVGSGNLLVAPYLLKRDSDFIYVGNTGTQSVLMYRPSDAQAIMGLVYLDKNTGNPGVLIASGTPFAGSVTGTAQVTPYIPYPSSSQEPLYAFRLVSGTTSLTWSNLYNARQFYGGSSSASTGSSGGGGISGVIVQDEGITQGTGTVFNFVGDNVSVSISGSVARVYVTGSAGGGASLPSFITGSVLFSSPSGTVTENNPLFRWDNTNSGMRLGPQNIEFDIADIYPLTVTAKNANESMGVMGYSYGTGSAGSPSFAVNGYRSRGTLLSPTPVGRGDALLSFLARGYDGSSFKTAGRIRFYSDGDFITGAYAPAKIDLEIVPSGSYTLRPQLSVYGDSVNIPTGSTYNIGGVPHTHGSGGGRELITSARTYYVRTDGSNSNDGLTNTSGGAFLTIQKAIDVAFSLDTNIYNVTIQVGNGTYTGQVIVDGGFTGKGRVKIKGDETTPANVVISVTSNDAVVVRNKASIDIGGVKITTTTSGHGLLITDQSNVNINGKVDFGAVPAGHIHIFCRRQAVCNISANYNITGGGGYHYACDNQSQIYASGITVTLSGTPAFGNVFVVCQSLSDVYGSASTYSGAATGVRYLSSNNSLINTAGGGANFYPGNSAGSTNTGGLYL